MNKRFKTLLMAGLVTTLTATSVVSSSALSKNKVQSVKTKGAIYLCINGVKYKIPFICNGKPSVDEDNSNGNNNNTNNDNNSNDNTNNDNDNNGVNNDTNNGNSNNDVNNNDTNNGDSNNDNNDVNNNNTNNDNNNNNNDSNNGNNNENNNDNTVEKPEDNNNSSNNDASLNGEFANFQKEVLRLVNVERSKRGLNELNLNTELSRIATLKSQDMINKNYFSHTSPTYGSPFDMMKKFNISYKTAGENIAMGQKTPAQVVEAWMNSEGHRANILNKNYTDLGVGVAKDSKGTIYWTQMFIGK
ncbi:CAP domain-containing protein [Terrisporobacter sp.]|uniref:CAP domain-containing protein n=1 Tax=Terrisporobacter sp. TaxID=1965305 RepID=UPI0026091539|nr:CAP domain-containing protein [Terrisporobacter sp.]